MYYGLSPRHLVILLLAAAAPLQFASAASVDWSGTTSTDFNLASNWITGAVPTGADNARFDSITGTTHQPTLTADTAIDRLTFNVSTGGWTVGGSGKTLTINGAGTTFIDASATHSGSNVINVDILVGPSSTGYIVSGSGGTLVLNGALNGAAGTTVKVGNTSTATGTVVLNHASTFAGNYLNNYGNTVIGADNVIGTGTYGLNGTGQITATNGARSLTSGMVFNQQGALNTTGTLSNSGKVELTVGGTNQSYLGAPGQRYINVNGSLTLSGAIVNGSGTSGAGIVVNSGTLNTGITVGTLILTGSNTYVGTTTVSNGTLLVNGNQSSATGAVSVASGATLGGIGTIGGATTVSGNLAAGNNGVGLLSFSNGLALNSSATSLFQINGLTRGTQFDAINITGALAYNGVLTLDFGFAAQVGQTFDLFDFTSQSGNFTSLNFVDLGYNGTFDAATGVLTLTSVPEPGVSILLLGAGLTLLVIRRRRSVVKG